MSILLRITYSTWEKSMRPLSPKPLASSLGKEIESECWRMRLKKLNRKKKRKKKLTKGWSL